MTTLLLFAWRELRRAKFRAGLIALILMIQAAALGGGYLAQESLYFTRDKWIDTLHLADVAVRFVPASAEEMPSLDAIRRIPGVAGAERRFTALGYIEKSGGSPVPMPVVVEYLDPGSHPTVDDVQLLSGRWLERGRPDLALVDRSFAAAHGLRIGDQLVVNPRRLESRFTVGGTGLSAEHLVPTANPELLVPHKGSLGVIYASRESLDRTFPDVLYNEVLVTFVPGADANHVTDAVLGALSKLEVERVVTKKATFGYRFIELVLAGSRSIAPTLAFIIALMASIVAFISMHRLIAERRREIGCLLAQGFSSLELAVVFFAIGLAPGVLGGLAGAPAAMLFAQKVTHTTAGISGFPDPIMVWDVRWLALAFGSALLVGVLSALPPALVVLRMQPSQALRANGDVTFSGMPVLLERLAFGSTSVRYALRNVFRRARLSLATAALVGLAVALPAALMTSLSSLDTWAKGQAEILGWDAIASFKVPLKEAHVTEMLADKGVAAWEGYIQGYAPMRREDGVVEETRVRGIPIGSDIIRFHLTSGRPFASDDADEAVLNTGFANGRPPRIGETVTLLRRGVPHNFHVVGLITDATLSTVFIPRRTAQRLFGLEGKVSGAYLRYGTSRVTAPTTAAPAPTPTPTRASNAEVLEKIDLDEAAPPAPAPTVRTFRDTKSALLDEDLVTGVQIRSEFAEANVRYLADFNVIVVPFVGLSGVLAFFFLVSVLGFLLIERENEYATLRSMGYATMEIACIVLTEVAVLAALGLVLSAAAWTLTAHALSAPMARVWFPVPLDFRLADYCACSLPTLAFLGLAALPGIRALMRIDLSATLRGRAIG
jgi:putative ABC transport system permease protein